MWKNFFDANEFQKNFNLITMPAYVLSTVTTITGDEDVAIAIIIVVVVFVVIGNINTNVIAG